MIFNKYGEAIDETTGVVSLLNYVITMPRGKLREVIGILSRVADALDAEAKSDAPIRR